MKIWLLLAFVFACGAAVPAGAQHRSSRAAKSRAAALKATAAARDKAERARRAEASAKAAALLPETSGPDADQLLRLDETWAQATLRNDAETITHLLADEYVAVSSQGLVSNKADVLAAIANDEAKCDVNKGFEYIVRVYGNTGLVIHNTSFRGLLNGVNTSGEYRVTHFFIKRNGKWLVAAKHTTFVVPERVTLVSKKDPRYGSERRRRKGRDVAGQ